MLKVIFDIIRTMNNDVPFVSNTPDDLHCLQAAYMMVVRFFKPDFRIDWEKWSSITGYEEGKGTWATAGLLWFKENGFEVKHLSLFNCEEFAKKGASYLTEEYGDEIGKWYIEHTNMQLEVERVKKLLKSGIFEQKEPTQSDIIHYLEDGYLVRCAVNSRKLNKEEGYFGHAVVISGYYEDGFIIQDPGSPPIKDRKVTFSDFESAWADPTKEAKELDAIKLI